MEWKTETVYLLVLVSWWVTTVSVWVGNVSVLPSWPYQKALVREGPAAHTQLVLEVRVPVFRASGVVMEGNMAHQEVRPRWGLQVSQLHVCIARFDGLRWPSHREKAVHPSAGCLLTPDHPVARMAAGPHRDIRVALRGLYDPSQRRRFQSLGLHKCPPTLTLATPAAYI